MRGVCENCPWRRDAPPAHWDLQHFRDIWESCQDDGLSTMLCHKATALPERERSRLLCQGWVRVMGFNAIGVRLAMMRGAVTMKEINDRSGPALYRSFAEMLHANGVTPPRRNKVIRGD